MRAFFHPEPADIALEHVLHALSDPVRLEIVRALSDVKMATSGELNLGRPKSSMSHHFRVLRDTDLIETQIVGTKHVNSLRVNVLDTRFPGLLHAILSQK